MIAAHLAKIQELPFNPQEQMHACSECGMYFPSSKTLRQHLARKHGIKVQELVDFQHRAAEHSVRGMPECAHCGIKVSSMGALRDHIRRNTCNWHPVAKHTKQTLS